MRSMRYFIALIAFFPVLLSYAGDDGSEKRAVAVIGADGVQRVAILGGSYYFDPNHIVVKANTPVELLIKKEPGATPHTIVLQAPEAGIGVEESIGTEPKIIRFIPTQTGTYSFACTKRFLFFKSHKNRGMQGILEVVE